MNINIKRLSPLATIPSYATDGSGCFDIYAMFENLGDKADIYPGGARAIRTGIQVAVPKDHVMLIYSRSGHGFNYDVRLANCVGVIDSDYRGEIMVKLTADGDGYTVRHGDRIAQGMIVPFKRVEFIEVDSLDGTARGSGGFGSTGA